MNMETTVEKKSYVIAISGTDGTYTERMLTFAEYELIAGICSELQTQYESVRIYEASDFHEF